jgi:hypothetical protein
MARRESALEQWACSWARFRGIVAAKLSEVDGIPDRIFFVPGGSPVIVEFKKVGKKGKGLQGATQPWYRAALLAAGYRTYHCDTKDEFREIMKEYKECRINEKTFTPSLDKARAVTSRTKK